MLVDEIVSGVEQGVEAHSVKLWHLMQRSYLQTADSLRCFVAQQHQQRNLCRYSDLRSPLNPVRLA